MPDSYGRPLWRSPLCRWVMQPAHPDRDEHEREPGEREPEHVPQRGGQPLLPFMRVMRVMRAARRARPPWSSEVVGGRCTHAHSIAASACKQPAGCRVPRACGRRGDGHRSARGVVREGSEPRVLHRGPHAAGRLGSGPPAAGHAASSAPRRSASSTRVSMIAPSASSAHRQRERVGAAAASSRRPSAARGGSRGGSGGRDAAADGERARGAQAALLGQEPDAATDVPLEPGERPAAGTPEHEQLPARIRGQRAQLVGARAYRAAARRRPAEPSAGHRPARAPERRGRGASRGRARGGRGPAGRSRRSRRAPPASGAARCRWAVQGGGSGPRHARPR